MARQMISLKWTNYEASIISSFSHFLAAEEYVDVTLTCAEGGTLAAHRLVLAACSQYLHDLLMCVTDNSSSSLSPSPLVVVLADVSFRDLQAVFRIHYDQKRSGSMNFNNTEGEKTLILNWLVK